MAKTNALTVLALTGALASPVAADFIDATVERQAFTNSHPGYTLTNVPFNVQYGNMAFDLSSNSAVAFTAQDVVATNDSSKVGMHSHYPVSPTNGQRVVVQVPVVVEKRLNGVLGYIPIKAEVQDSVSNLAVQTILDGLSNAVMNATNSYNGGREFSSAGVLPHYKGLTRDLADMGSNYFGRVSTVPETGAAGALAAVALYSRRRQSVKSFGRRR